MIGKYIRYFKYSIFYLPKSFDFNSLGIEDVIGSKYI